MSKENDGTLPKLFGFGAWFLMLIGVEFAFNVARAMTTDESCGDSLLCNDSNVVPNVLGVCIAVACVLLGNTGRRLVRRERLEAAADPTDYATYPDIQIHKPHRQLGIACIVIGACFNVYDVVQYLSDTTGYHTTSRGHAQGAMGLVVSTGIDLAVITVGVLLLRRYYKLDHRTIV